MSRLPPLPSDWRAIGLYLLATPLTICEFAFWGARPTALFFLAWMLGLPTFLKGDEKAPKVEPGPEL